MRSKGANNCNGVDNNNCGNDKGHHSLLMKEIPVEEVLRTEGIDVAVLQSIKKALKIRGVSQDTASLKGERRRHALELRLRRTIEESQRYKRVSTTTAELKKRYLSTATPGLEGVERAKVLFARLEKVLLRERLQLQAQRRLDSWKVLTETGPGASPTVRRQRLFKSLNQKQRNYALDSAIIRLNFPEMEEIVARGADVDYETRGGYTVLLRAVHFNRRLVIASMVQKHGASLEKETRSGMTALQWAITIGAGGGRDAQDGVSAGKAGGIGDGGESCVSLVRYLLHLGAKLDHETSVGGTPMLTAVEFGRLDIVCTLLECSSSAGKDNQGRLQLVNQANREGLTPLIQSAIHRRPRVLRYLIRNGAAQFAKDVEGRDAVAWARRQNHTDIVRILDAFLAVPRMVELGNNERDVLHQVALMDRALMDNNFEVALALIRTGFANCDHETSTGYTPLNRAAYYGRVDVLEALLAPDCAATLSFLNQRGQSSLMLAAVTGQTAAVSFLVRMGADVNREDHEGNTPLIFASRDGHANTAKLLVRLGAFVDHTNRLGVSAMVAAAANHHPGVVGVLAAQDATFASIEKNVRKLGQKSLPDSDLAIRRDHTDESQKMQELFRLRDGLQDIPPDLLRIAAEGDGGGVSRMTLEQATPSSNVRRRRRERIAQQKKDKDIELVKDFKTRLLDGLGARSFINESSSPVLPSSSSSSSSFSSSAASSSSRSTSKVITKNDQELSWLSNIESVSSPVRPALLSSPLRREVEEGRIQMRAVPTSGHNDPSASPDEHNGEKHSTTGFDVIVHKMCQFCSVLHAHVWCLQCHKLYCQRCWLMVHATEMRRFHKAQPYDPIQVLPPLGGGERSSEAHLGDSAKKAKKIAMDVSTRIRAVHRSLGSPQRQKKCRAKERGERRDGKKMEKASAQKSKTKNKPSLREQNIGMRGSERARLLPYAQPAELDLADMYIQAGRLEEAQAQLEEALTIQRKQFAGEENYPILHTKLVMAKLEAAKGRHGRTIKICSAILEALDRIYQEERRIIESEEEAGRARKRGVGGRGGKEEEEEEEEEEEGREEEREEEEEDVPLRLIDHADAASVLVDAFIHLQRFTGAKDICENILLGLPPGSKSRLRIQLLFDRITDKEKAYQAEQQRRAKARATPWANLHQRTLSIDIFKKLLCAGAGKSREKEHDTKTQQENNEKEDDDDDGVGSYFHAAYPEFVKVVKRDRELATLDFWRSIEHFRITFDVLSSSTKQQLHRIWKYYISSQRLPFLTRTLKSAVPMSDPHAGMFDDLQVVACNTLYLGPFKRFISKSKAGLQFHRLVILDHEDFWDDIIRIQRTFRRKKTQKN